MIVAVTSKYLIALAARVLKALKPKSGNQLELLEEPDAFVSPSRHIDPTRLAPLRDKLRRGRGTFNLARVREQVYETSLRE
ncbi:MAG: hypothetical protein OXO52_15765 [Rhodospirillales bacterium]|nr:hypothetical protein [Rhodospirillales bacterium]MDE0381070.1 hypothetical protein [Rhodospirillales bacterium]